MSIKKMALIGLLFIHNHSSWAEIVTDGSVGVALNLNGPNFQIDQTLGAQFGKNLFHSFSRFNLNSQQSATFTGSNTIQNVISRVTGGSVSTIDGLLTSQVGQADFYFVNPAGIVFGKNAQINVPAAFYASTAAELKFADGGSFNALNPENSQLTLASPDSFGFNNDHTGQINITSEGLTFKPGTKVNFNSQNLNIDQAEIQGEGLQLQLIAVGQQDQDINIQSLPNHSLQGEINIQQTLIDISGNGTEQLQIRGEHTTILDSRLVANNIGNIDHNRSPTIDARVSSLLLGSSKLTSEAQDDGRAGNIDIAVDNNLTILNSGNISASTFASGGAGAINIRAAEVFIDGQGSNIETGILSNTNTDSTGNAGEVNVAVNERLILRNGGRISSNSFGAGNAGKVSVSAGEIKIERFQSSFFTGIFSNAGRSSRGNAGSVTVNVQGLLALLNGGRISSNTSVSNPIGTGNAGRIDITATELLIDNQGSEFGTGISSDSFVEAVGGRAGEVTVKVSELLKVVNGGRISSVTFAKGEGADAGRVVVSAGELFIDGQDAETNTGILSDSFRGSDGGAGDVIIDVEGLLTLLNRGRISSNTATNKDAGAVTVTAGEILIDGQTPNPDTGIISNAEGGSAGMAGQVTVDIEGLLTVLNGGRISSNTFGQGDAGNVSVTAKEVQIERLDSPFFTGIFTNAGGASKGNAGEVNVTVEGLLTLMTGGRISSNTSVSDVIGNAGIVIVNAGEVLIDNNNSNDGTGITSDAFRNSDGGDAGQVIVNSTGLISVLNGGRITSSTFGLGNANSVEINAGKLIVKGEFIRNANSEPNPSQISSLSQGSNAGNVGTVTITADQSVELSNGGAILITSASERSNLQDDLNRITVISPKILLNNNSQISAETTGTTAASNIILTANKLIFLQDSQITTSATGKLANGDGGNIDVNSPILVLDTGFIQANTTAIGANGGRIELGEVEVIIPSSNALLSGGDEIVQFTPGVAGNNVIQAAAPDGINGSINNTPPELNITSALASIEEPDLDLEGIGQNPCSPTLQNNTLKNVGRGAVTLFKKGQQLQTLERILKSTEEQQPEKDSSLKLHDDMKKLHNKTIARLPLTFSGYGCNKPDQQGYVNSGALIPEQNLKDGVLNIDIIEGKLNEISMEGQGWLHPDYIRSRLLNDQPFNVNELQERYLLLLNDPLIKNLNANYKSLPTLGESALDLTITRERPYQLALHYNNYNPPSIGAEQIQVEGWVRNLTRRGDKIDFRYDGSEGADSFSGGFAIPLTAQDTSFDFHFDIGRSSVIEQPLDSVDIQSEVRNFSWSLSHPFYRDTQQMLTLGIKFASRRSQTSLLDQNFSFIEGLDTGRSKVTVLRLFQEYMRRFENHVLAFRSTFNTGIDSFDSSIQKGDTFPDSEFFSWLGQLQYAYKLNEQGAQIRLRSNIQLSNEALLPQERIAIGGIYSIRGYRENELVRDNGYSGSIELHYPLYSIEGRFANSLTLVPFMDYGLGWNHKDKTDELHSVGIGLNWQALGHIKAEIYYAHDLITAVDKADHNLQDEGVHFNVSIYAF